MEIISVRETNVVCNFRNFIFNESLCESILSMEFLEMKSNVVDNFRRQLFEAFFIYHFLENHLAPSKMINPGELGIRYEGFDKSKKIINRIEEKIFGKIHEGSIKEFVKELEGSKVLNVSDDDKKCELYKKFIQKIFSISVENVECNELKKNLLKTSNKKIKI